MLKLAIAVNRHTVAVVCQMGLCYIDIYRTTVHGVSMYLDSKNSSLTGICYPSGHLCLTTQMHWTPLHRQHYGVAQQETSHAVPHAGHGKGWLH